MKEESVVVHLPLSGDDMGSSQDWEEMVALENSLNVVLDQPMLGILKVTRATDGLCRFKMVGPSADKIHKAIERTLANSKLSPEGYVILNYADGRPPAKLPLRPANAVVRNLRRELTIALGLAAGILAVLLHRFFAVPTAEDGSALPLSPIERMLLNMESASVLLGVGFYVSRRFARWVGDHYSEMIMEERQRMYLRWMNCLCGAFMLFSRTILVLLLRRVGVEDVVMLVLGAYLVVNAFWQQIKEQRQHG